MAKTKPLYINLHIPKTAGYTLRYHITKNLKPSEHLLIDYPGMDLFNPPLEYEIYKKEAYKLIKSLSREKRENIKIIHGHTVPYGVHELFDREVRYFIFVRNPVNRTVSIYNHLSYLNKVEGHEFRKHAYYEKYLLIDGKDPGFPVWLEKKYRNDLYFHHFSLSGYLKEFGYLNGVVSKSSIKEALKKFYFLGLTENYSDEVLYIFNNLGFHKYFMDQNISHLSYKINNKDVELVRNLVNKNKLDIHLYNEATKLNGKFRENNDKFEEIINYKKFERKFLLPFTQPLFAPRQTIIRFYKSIVAQEPLSAH